MYEMVDKEYIRKRHFVDGWSIREISRTLKISRQTVRKMLKDAEVPKYQLKAERPCPVMDRWKPVIEAWLQEDQRAGVPRKQRHTAARIYERLVEEYPDFNAAESTVRRLVAKLRQNTPEAYVPLTADAGEIAEADFGSAVVKIQGQSREVHLFVMRLRYSGVTFVRAFSSEKLEAFLEGHRYAFEWFNGVPHGVRYDNPKTAVTKILAGPMREEHSMLSSVRAHYLFDSVFCRPGEPHEKGGVENHVGYVRRNALVPVPDFEDMDSLNEHLMKWCEKERAKKSEVWEIEKKALRPLPIHPHRCATVHPVVVNKLCLVSFNHNRYSVPSMYVGKTLLLRAYAEKIELVERDRVVANHVRCHERKQTFLELAHYLPVLAQKPHAVTHAAVVRQLPDVYQKIRLRMSNSRPDGYKDFVAILLLHRIYPAQSILAAIEMIGVNVVNAELIESYLTKSDKPYTAGAVPDELQKYRVAKQNPARYDMLAKGMVH
jgi:transposase